MNTWSNKLKNYIYFKWELFLESKWKVPCLSFFETIRLMMIIICFVISSYDICALRTLETTTTSKAIDVALFLFIVASWCKIHPLTPKPNQPTNHRRNPMTTHQPRPQIPLFPPLKIDCLTYTLHETSKHSTWKNDHQFSGAFAVRSREGTHNKKGGQIRIKRLGHRSPRKKGDRKTQDLSIGKGYEAVKFHNIKHQAVRNHPHYSPKN